MRGAAFLGLLVSAGIVGISSAALTAVDIVSASANGWDTRTERDGCAPDSCIASNAIDGSVEYDSRWSCRPGDPDSFEACELTIELSEPQDIKEIRVALWKGDERTRLVNILVEGAVVATIESSGTTEGYEPYQVEATQVSTIVLQAAGSNDETYNRWLSILDIEVMVESDLAVSPPSPAPTDPFYVGCFNDMIDDRIMSAAMIMDDLTSEVCSAACREMRHLYYALQQGNECWCAGCDLTDGDTNTAYDRHGSGSCFTACAGDSSSECGGDMAFGLFLTGNCGEICPEDTFSSDGTPPCIACAEGRSAEEGATTCNIAAFEDIDIPDEVAAAILADAIGGFAGPVSAYDITGHGSTFDTDDLENRFYDITAEDGSTLQLTGKFAHSFYVPVDGYTFPPSTALTVYIDSERGEGLIVGQASLDLSAREFSITVEDLPGGPAKAYFSFIALDPDQTPQYFGPGSVFFVDVVNNAACASPLTITLEWDAGLSYTSEDDTYNDFFALYIQEPDGAVVTPGMIGDFGFTSITAVAYGMVYTVYGGVASASGIYTARVYPRASFDIAFTLTAEVNGETVWVEEGMWFGTEEGSSNFSGWDEAPPLGSFSVTLGSIPAC